MPVQQPTEIKAKGSQGQAEILQRRFLALDDKVRSELVIALNQILADTMSLRDLYKKHHWQTSGTHFYELHLLFDKHYEEQSELIDIIGERIQTLGGDAVAIAADVAERTNIPRPPLRHEQVGSQLFRLAQAHEIVIGQTRTAVRRATELGDEGTNDVLVSNVLRLNEKQVWFIAQQLSGNSV
ncbi:MAG TPA: DNA starvation/stationary phase protection protein [Bryobacteraceae bacterium]|jgi:starvation-inducible DNA-binding protein|nr:DNA starvation/stationary phase protection protein [Bryobacteraceae bacterium]